MPPNQVNGRHDSAEATMFGVVAAATQSAMPDNAASGRPAMNSHGRSVMTGPEDSHVSRTSAATPSGSAQRAAQLAPKRTITTASAQPASGAITRVSVG